MDAGCGCVILIPAGINKVAMQDIPVSIRCDMASQTKKTPSLVHLSLVPFPSPSLERVHSSHPVRRVDLLCVRGGAPKTRTDANLPLSENS